MLIRFERTGGFAGLSMEVTIDTASLPSEEGRRLEELIKTAGFFDLPGEVAGPPRGADDFLYRLTVEDKGRQHTLQMDDTAVPATLRPLIHRLTRAARRKPGGGPPNQ